MLFCVLLVIVQHSCFVDVYFDVVNMACYDYNSDVICRSNGSDSVRETQRELRRFGSDLAQILTLDRNKVSTCFTSAFSTEVASLFFLFVRKVRIGKFPSTSNNESIKKRSVWNFFQPSSKLVLPLSCQFLPQRRLLFLEVVYLNVFGTFCSSSKKVELPY